MSSTEFKQCPSCGTVGHWRSARTRGLIKRKLAALLGLRPYRCTVCRRRVVVFGGWGQISSTGQRDPDGTAPFQEVSSGNGASKDDDEEFRQLIADLRRSEETMEQDVPG